MKNNNTGIRLSDVWNDAVISKADRELKPREYAWASEMGQPLIDRYLKMRAVPPTNPPNDRARRKFFGGNVWETIVWMAFNFAGLVQSKQTEVWVKSGAIPVKGKLDFVIGGIPDFDKAERDVFATPLPDDMRMFYGAILKRMREMYSGEYFVSVKELKSLSTFMFDSIMRKDKAIMQHELQLLHYVMGTEIERGGICYVCRDDARLMEFELKDREALEKKYFHELEVLSVHLDEEVSPSPEPLIKFEDRFSKNLGVEYSGYLEKVYGFKTPEDYRLAVDGKVGRWNRVLARIKEGKDMTKNNKEAIAEMKKEGWNAEELVTKIEIIPETEDTITTD